MANEHRRKARRESDRRQSDRRTDLLGLVMSGVTTSQLAETLTPKNARVEIRCDMDTKAEIEAVAGRFGLTVTDYILRLHALAAAKLGSN
jgi:hypothetical protein